MDQKLIDVRDNLIFKAGYIAANLGLSKAMGQLYAALYISNKPIALEQLAQTCRMSKGNASINMRRLERWGAVKKSWGQGDRRDYYEANKDIIGFAVNHGLKTVSNLMGEAEGILSESKAMAQTIDKASLSPEERAAFDDLEQGFGEVSRLSKKIRSISNNFMLFKGLIDKL